jgi:hypothetical protein
MRSAAVRMSMRSLWMSAFVVVSGCSSENDSASNDTPECAPGQLLCGDVCVDAMVDAQHCEACFDACQAGTCP